MDNLFEIIMLVCFCVAMTIMIFRFAKQKSIHIKHERALVIMFGIGFVLGAIGKAMIVPVHWTFALYVIGGYLSYTATVFSFYNPKTQNEVNKDE